MKGLRFNGSGMAAMVVASSMLTYCQPVRAWQPKLDPDDYKNPASAIASSPVSAAAPSRLGVPSVLKSRWGKGACEYHNQSNSVTYTDAATGKKANVVFDVKMKNAQVLLCSVSFTVILTLQFPQRAIVGLGGGRIFDGEQDFGSLGGVQGYAGFNSYGFPLVKAAVAGINGNTITLNGNLFSFRTASGETWATDISDLLSPWKVN